MIFAATQMANRLTVPFAPGADSLLLTLTDAAPGAALVSAYDFQEHTARYDHIPQPRYVVQALRDSAQAVTLAIDYDAAGIAGMQTAVLTIPAGTLAGESFALDLGGRDAVSQITGLTQTPPDGSAAQNWAVFALLGQTAKLLWTLGRERDQIRARQAKAREQRRLGAALGQSLDWIGADLGIPRFPPLPYGFDPQTIALYHLDDSPGSGQAEVAAAADAMQGYGLPGHPASNPGAAGQTARSGAAGRFSSGFAFRSDSARLEAASSPDFDFAAADSFTLECFVRPDSDTGAGPLLSRCANSSDPAKPGYALETGDFGRGPVRSVRFLASDGTRQIALFLDDTLPTDRFSHLAAVIDRDRGEARLSLDGAQRAAAPLKNLGAISNAEPLRMGGGPFRGTLDEVRLSRAAYAQFAPALGEGDAMYRQRLEIFRRWTLPTAASLQQAVNAVSGPIGGDAEPILINDAPPTQHSDTLPITILPWNMPMGQSLNAQGNPKAREADVCGILADGPAFDPAFCVTFADPQCVSDPPPARVLHPGEPAPDAAKMRAGTANRLRSLLALLNRNFGGGILHILSAFDPRADDLRAAGRGLWLRHDFGGSGFLGALALQAGFEWVQTASDPNDIYSDEIYVSSPPGEDLEINLTPQDAAFDALVGQALTVSFSPSLPRGDAAQWQVISCGAAQAALAAGSNPSSMNLLASAPGLLTLRAEVMHNGQRYVGSRTLQIGIGSLPDGASLAADGSLGATPDMAGVRDPDFHPAYLLTADLPGAAFSDLNCRRMQTGTARRLSALLALLQARETPGTLSITQGWQPDDLTGLAGAGRALTVAHSTLDAGALAPLAQRAGFTYCKRTGNTLLLLQKAEGLCAIEAAFDAELAARELRRDDSGVFLHTTTGDAGQTIRVAAIEEGMALDLTFGLAAAPAALAVFGDLIYTANSGSDTVSEMRAGTGNVLRVFKVGWRPVALAVRYDGKRACVANSKSGVSVIDLTTPDGKTASVSVGGAPVAVAHHPSQPILYVCCDDNTLTAIHTDTFAVLGSAATGKGPRSVAVTPDGKEIWVALETDNQIQIFNSTPLAASGAIALPFSPLVLALAPNGSVCYAALREETPPPPHAPPIPIALQSGHLAIVQVSGRTVTKTVPTRAPVALTVSPDSRTVYLIEEAFSIPPYAALGAVAGNCPIRLLAIVGDPANPSDLAPAPAPDLVYVPPHPSAIAASGTHVYAASRGSDTVSDLFTGDPASAPNQLANVWRLGSGRGEQRVWTLQIAPQSGDALSGLSSSSAVFQAAEPGFASVRAVYSLADNPAPYTFEARLKPALEAAPGIVIRKEQYDRIMNALNALHPVGVEVVTRALQERVLELQGGFGEAFAAYTYPPFRDPAPASRPTRPSDSL